MTASKWLRERDARAGFSVRRPHAVAIALVVFVLAALSGFAVAVLVPSLALPALALPPVALAGVLAYWRGSRS